jgi:hypothetical protein
MLVEVVQRWRDRRGVYRPAREPLRTELYEVAPLASDREARLFVEQHHYLATYPAARFRFGLYEGPFLVGVAVFSVPTNDKALAVLGCNPRDAIELGRLVLLDRVPANAESWFIARCFELLRRAGLAGVISFSDPVPRAGAGGEVVFPGHLGTVYQALNAVYLGRATARTLRLLPDGTVFSDRAAQKIRGRERGWCYAVELLERHGAEALGEQEDPAAWLAGWLSRIARPLRHGGNHKYAWPFVKSCRKALPPSLAYPKLSVR